MTDEIASTRSLYRFQMLLAALRDGPLTQAALFTRLGSAYPATSSRRVMVYRDIAALADLGIIIDKVTKRPTVYALRGGTPAYTETNLRTLALVRDQFGPRHPQFAALATLLDTLTAGLDTAQRAIYDRRQTSNAPLQPAVDYGPHAATIARLEHAISLREIVRFDYRNTKGETRKHRAEPYEIEYHDRHFYLVAYNTDTRQMLDYRVDRVTDIRSEQTLTPENSRTHARETVRFRYRLAAVLTHGEISQRFEHQRVVERHANGDAVIEAEGRSDFFVIQTLLRYRNLAELLEPAWLRDKMAAEVRALAAVYEAEGD